MSENGNLNVGGGSHCQQDEDSADARDPDDPEDDEILEESPCKRWSKRREKVKQRDVPGIDAAYLAMDNETGNEVVWNEVLFSERKNFREQEEKIRAVFDNLVRLEHPNLVKFHKYWMDTKSDKPRIIFITEYMSSGSMSRFLQRARSSGSLLNRKAWKSWARQILTALSYLHSCDPPIVHANLTCNSVFIQQNGLVKIGCVAPKTIHHHVKTFRENIKNVHYLAPEYDHQTETTIQADIYSFGVCALEMATTGALQSGCFNGASTASAAASATASSVPSVSSSASLPPHAATASATPSEKERQQRGGGIAAAAGGGCGRPIENGGGPTAAVAVAAMMTSASSSSTLPAVISNGPTTAAPPLASCSHVVTQEMVYKALNSLDQPEQKQFIERCLELDPARRANVTELLDRLGPPEPEPDPDDALVAAPSSTIATTTATAAAAATSTTTSSSAASSNATSTAATQAAKTMMANNNGNAFGGGGAGNGHGQQQHQHSLANNNNACNNNNCNNAISSTAASTTLATPQSAAADEGYHTNQSILLDVSGGGGNVGHHHQQQQHHHHHNHHHSDTVTGCFPDCAGQLPPPPPPSFLHHQQQHREVRQIVQLHADLLDPDADGVATKLRVQLQLDDLMNRQLTAILRDGDTADSLAAELVQNGFVSEANSPKVCDLLAKVIGARILQQQQLCASRNESSPSAAVEEPQRQQQQSPTASKTNC